MFKPACLFSNQIAFCSNSKTAHHRGSSRGARLFFEWKMHLLPVHSGFPPFHSKSVTFFLPDVVYSDHKQGSDKN